MYTNSVTFSKSFVADTLIVFFYIVEQCSSCTLGARRVDDMPSAEREPVVGVWGYLPPVESRGKDYSEGIVPRWVLFKVRNRAIGLWAKRASIWSMFS